MADDSQNKKFEDNLRSLATLHKEDSVELGASIAISILKSFLPNATVEIKISRKKLEQFEKKIFDILRERRKRKGIHDE